MPNETSYATQEFRLKFPFVFTRYRFQLNCYVFTKFLAWQRFYFDPPEFQTLFISNKDTFHLGYYRVAPDQMPAFVVGNEGTNKIVTSEGSNLLAAFKNYIWMKQRESSRTGASNLKKVK